MRTFVAYKH